MTQKFWCSVVGEVSGPECLCNGHGHPAIPFVEPLATPEPCEIEETPEAVGRFFKPPWEEGGRVMYVVEDEADFVIFARFPVEGVRE